MNRRLPVLISLQCGRALKLKRNAKPVKIGWLTPLLGVLVILDLTSFWVLAWDAQAQIAANYPTLYLSEYLNIASLKTEGVDVEANYQTKVLDRPLNLRVLGSWQPHLIYSDQPGSTASVEVSSRKRVGRSVVRFWNGLERSPRPVKM